MPETGRAHGKTDTFRKRTAKEILGLRRAPTAQQVSNTLKGTEAHIYCPPAHYSAITITKTRILPGGRYANDAESEAVLNHTSNFILLPSGNTGTSIPEATRSFMRAQHPDTSLLGDESVGPLHQEQPHHPDYTRVAHAAIKAAQTSAGPNVAKDTSLMAAKSALREAIPYRGW